MMKSFRALVALLILSAPAVAQQIQPGQILGNPTGARAPASPTTISAILGLTTNCATRGSIPFRGASAIECLAPGTAGLALRTGGAGADPSYGILALAAGGSGANLTASNGGLVYSNATTMAILAGTATAGQIPRSGASAAPSWSTATYPATIAQGDVVYGSAANVISGLTKDTNATRYLSNTGASNAPAWAQVNVSNGVTGTMVVANGGTNCGAASGTCVDNISGFASTGIMSRTGAGAYSFSTISTLIDAIGSTRGSILYRGAAGWAILAPGSSGNFLTSNGVGADPSYTAAAGSGTVTSVTITAGTAITSSGTCTSTTIITCTVNVDKATAANYYAATSNKVPTTDIIYPSEVTVTYGTTTTFDFDTFINAAVTLTGNITTQTLSNARAGKAGTIAFIQDGTGSRTTVWNSIFKFAGGTTPTLTTTLNAIDVLSYSCRSTTYCAASLMKDVK